MVRPGSPMVRAGPVRFPGRIMTHTHTHTHKTKQPASMPKTSSIRSSVSTDTASVKYSVTTLKIKGLLITYELN